MAPIILGYWDIRGLAQPIRLLLTYTGQEWENKLYSTQDEWLQDKFSLGLDFPNLPYMIDGDLKISQSNAILRYLARKTNLLGETEEEKIRVDLLESEINDFRREWLGMCYSPNFESLKGPYLEGLPAKLTRLSDFLGDRSFFAGETITFPDFIVYEMLDQHNFLTPDYLDAFPSLQKFHERIASQKTIAEFLSSPKHFSYPLNGSMASFGGALTKPE